LYNFPIKGGFWVTWDYCKNITDQFTGVVFGASVVAVIGVVAIVNVVAVVQLA